MAYPVWVDWLCPSWTDYELDQSDWASRPFESRKLAKEFALQICRSNQDANVLLYERANGNADDEQCLFIFAQANAENKFKGHEGLQEIKTGFGYRWNDGNTDTSPEEYIPLVEV